ncbi:6204_t:CDS:2, partial [Gigaspora rosea]
VPNVIKEDAVVRILVSDNVNNIRPRESFIFIVGQLEIIKNEFYIYTRDINCVDAQFNSKKNIFDRLPSTVLSDNSNKFKSNSLLSDTHSSNRVRVEDFDDSIEEFYYDFAENSKGRKEDEGVLKSNVRQKGKECVDGSLCVNLCSRGLNSNVDIVKE